MHNEVEFNLQISNVQLTPLYSFRASSDMPFLNEMNKWMQENLLIWDIDNKVAQFNFPRRYSSPQTAALEIVPNNVIFKPVQMIGNMSINFLDVSDTKEKQLQ